jgi:stress-induced morphogen
MRGALARPLLDLVVMPTPDAIRARLLAAFPGARVDVADLTGTQDHFQASVVAKQFEGKSRVEQHKLVYAALGELMDGAIHALALKTTPITPETP